MGALTAKSVTEAALTSSRFIENFSIKHKFQNEIKKLTDHNLGIILSKSSSESSKSQAIQDLKQEKLYLSKQENILKNNIAKKYAFIEIKKQNDTYTYVLKGIGLVAGAAQFITGLAIVTATSQTVVGYVAGSALIIHGAGNIEENLTSLLNNDAYYKGYLRIGYEHAFDFIGSDKKLANLVYGGVDIALSGYGIFRNVLKPEAWRLFYYIKDDYVTSYKTMSGYSLMFEMSVDGVTLKSTYDAYNDPNNSKK
ncbi:DUF4225 domain-containing protein [Xenorhabdus bovienii]|nr:DUF4225 domain-containing protein [Xenorhabdus bovienii]MDE9430104.1 DUF4225 domain-containing protein [Xenorhabdus bovienii]MDE9436835.1 DUF4225 domain-containing protein [Xenorhabdus bovienii]MDE9443472.1 DUF4225 domain-containing protein [Xenorhabdus bovienii]MDE9459274.1 DUF4225 domain-containing protein [Xenorhabdus bovienii]